MRIFVSAKARAKRTEVKKIADAHFAVAVKEPARDGRANVAIARALANYFGIAPSRVVLVRGQGAKQKMFEISHAW